MHTAHLLTVRGMPSSAILGGGAILCPPGRGCHPLPSLGGCHPLPKDGTPRMVPLLRMVPPLRMAPLLRTAPLLRMVPPS